jgi:hypothetical protein
MPFLIEKLTNISFSAQPSGHLAAISKKVRVESYLLLPRLAAPADATRELVFVSTAGRGG